MGRYCRSGSYPTPGRIHCVPSSTVFYLARCGGWQRVANRHLHRDTMRQQNRTAIFRPYTKSALAHFYSERCPLRRSSPLCSKCRWRWGKRRRPVCRDQTPPLHPAGRRSDALHPLSLPGWPTTRNDAAWRCRYRRDWRFPAPPGQGAG